MLKGDPEDPNTSIGRFAKAFHTLAFVEGERLIAYPDGSERAYTKAVKRFFEKIKSGGAEIREIDDRWFDHIEKSKLVILAAGHSIGFIGYMSLVGGEYRFKALEIRGSANFLHELYEALSNFYYFPPTNGSSVDTIIPSLSTPLSDVTVPPDSKTQ